MPAATAPISRSTVKARLDDFSHHWRRRIDPGRAGGQGHTEKSAAQQFWSDLFGYFGIIPERIDLFERDTAPASTGVRPDIIRAGLSNYDKLSSTITQALPLKQIWVPVDTAAE